jgi:anthranilate synthase/aminodeoxychorismate synthase-like glutamine amidotransferase
MVSKKAGNNELYGFAMILLIDNYDSFAHNLARYFERLGQIVRMVRNDAIDAAAVRDMRPAGLVLSPGPCTPREAGTSLEIVRALHTEVPMLGVCLGHQVIAEALGGKIGRAQTPVHGQTSPIAHDGTGLFAGLPSPMNVARYHSLVAEAGALPAELCTTAWTEDGVLMAFEHVRHPVYGVQFHPESILTECGFELLANFLRLADIDVPVDPRELRTSELRSSAMGEQPLPVGPVTF